MMKKLLAMVLSLALVLTCVSALAADVLHMATSAGFPPYEYYENDQVVGIDAEIAALIAQLDRRAKLTLSGAEMARRAAEGVFQIAAADQCRCDYE